MDADEALSHLGRFGRWQLIRYCLLCLSVTVSGCWHMMVIVFTGTFPCRDLHNQFDSINLLVFVSSCFIVLFCHTTPHPPQLWTNFLVESYGLDLTAIILGEAKKYMPEVYPDYKHILLKVHRPICTCLEWNNYQCLWDAGNKSNSQSMTSKYGHPVVSMQYVTIVCLEKIPYNKQIKGKKKELKKLSWIISLFFVKLVRTRGPGASYP